MYGAGVSNWTDKSNSGFIAAQFTESNKPTYASSTITFANTTYRCFNVSGSPTSYDFITVGKALASGDWRVLFYTGGNYILQDASTVSYGGYNAGFFRADTLTWGNVDGISYGRVSTTASPQLSRDGGSLYSIATTFPNAAITHLGNSTINQPWGDIKEFILVPFNSATDVKEKLEGYAAHRWGLAGLLPSGHTYKLAPPPSPSLDTAAFVGSVAWVGALAVTEAADTAVAANILSDSDTWSVLGVTRTGTLASMTMTETAVTSEHGMWVYKTSNYPASLYRLSFDFKINGPQAANRQVSIGVWNDDDTAGVEWWFNDPADLDQWLDDIPTNSIIQFYRNELIDLGGGWYTANFDVLTRTANGFDFWLYLIAGTFQYPGDGVTNVTFNNVSLRPYGGFVEWQGTFAASEATDTAAIVGTVPVSISGTLATTEAADFAQGTNLAAGITWTATRATLTGTGSPYTLAEDGSTGDHYLEHVFVSPPSAGAFCCSFEYKGAGPTPRGEEVDIYDANDGASVLTWPNGTTALTGIWGTTGTQVFNVTVNPATGGFLDVRIYYRFYVAPTAIGMWLANATSPDRYTYTGLNDGSGIQFRNFDLRNQGFFGYSVWSATLAASEAADTAAIVGSIPVISGTLATTEATNFALGTNCITNTWATKIHVTLTGTGNPYVLAEDSSTGGHVLEEEFAPQPLGSYCYSVEFKGTGPSPRGADIVVWGSANSEIDFAVRPDGVSLGTAIWESANKPLLFNTTVDPAADGFWNIRLYFQAYDTQQWADIQLFNVAAANIWSYPGSNDGSGVQFRNAALTYQGFFGYTVWSATLAATEAADTAAIVGITLTGSALLAGSTSLKVSAFSYLPMSARLGLAPSLEASATSLRPASTRLDSASNLDVIARIRTTGNALLVSASALQGSATQCLSAQALLAATGKLTEIDTQLHMVLTHVLAVQSGLKVNTLTQGQEFGEANLGLNAGLAVSTIQCLAVSPLLALNASLTASVALQLPASALLSNAGSFASSSSIRTTGNALLANVSRLSVNASGLTTGAALLAGDSSLVADATLIIGAVEHLGSALLASDSVLSVAISRRTTGSALLATTGQLLAVAVRQHVILAERLAAQSGLGADVLPRGVVSAEALLGASSSLAAITLGRLSAVASAAVSASLPGIPTQLLAQSSARLAVGVDLGALVSVRTTAAVRFDATSGLSAAVGAFREWSASALLGPQTSLVASASCWVRASALLAPSAGTLADANALRPAQGMLAADGRLTASAVLLRRAVGLLEASSTLQARTISWSATGAVLQALTQCSVSLAWVSHTSALLTGNVRVLTDAVVVGRRIALLGIEGRLAAAAYKQRIDITPVRMSGRPDVNVRVIGQPQTSVQMGGIRSGAPHFSGQPQSNFILNAQLAGATKMTGVGAMYIQITN